MRFSDKTNRPILSSNDIFPLSSGSGENWTDYNIKWGQIVSLLNNGLVPKFNAMTDTEVSQISAGGNANIATIELTNTAENNELDFELCLNFDLTLESGATSTRVTVSLNTTDGSLFSISQDYFADGRYLLEVKKHLVLENEGNYIINLNLSVSSTGNIG